MTTWLMLIVQLGLAGNMMAEVVVTRITVDGKDLPVKAPVAENTEDGVVLRLPPWLSEIEFAAEAKGLKMDRPFLLRYKLEGYDKDWTNVYSHMRLVARMLDEENNIIAATDFKVDLQSAGWRGSVQNSDFIPHRAQVIAPPRAAKMQLWCVSGGPEYTTGVFAIKNVSVSVGEPSDGFFHQEKYSTEEGADLDQPLGSLRDWKRDGSRPEMAQVARLEKPQPHHALVLSDFDTNTFAAWIVPPERCVPVRPGDRVSVQWEEAHMVGCGAGAFSYRRLAPGNYWLRVVAVGMDNTPVAPEMSLPFVVLAPFWNRLWFWLLCGSGGIMAAVWGVRRFLKNRWQRELDRLERRHVLERERTRIARDFHDDLGTRLTQISMLSESACRRSNNPPETVADLNRICGAAREFTRSMEEIVWAVDPENDSLDELATFISGFAQELLRGVEVRCRLDMPLQLPDWNLSAEVRHNLFMAFKEALNNALKHGQPTEVRITMTTEPSRFVIMVEDNGRGMAQAYDSGHGLKNMRSRLQKIGGEFDLESEQGQGTRVRFIVPVKGMAN